MSSPPLLSKAQRAECHQVCVSASSTIALWLLLGSWRRKPGHRVASAAIQARSVVWHDQHRGRDALGVRGRRIRCAPGEPRDPSVCAGARPVLPVRAGAGGPGVHAGDAGALQVQEAAGSVRQGVPGVLGARVPRVRARSSMALLTGRQDGDRMLLLFLSRSSTLTSSRRRRRGAPVWCTPPSRTSCPLLPAGWQARRSASSSSSLLLPRAASQPTNSSACHGPWRRRRRPAAGPRQGQRGARDEQVREPFAVCQR